MGRLFLSERTIEGSHFNQCGRGKSRISRECRFQFVIAVVLIFVEGFYGPVATGEPNNVVVPYASTSVLDVDGVRSSESRLCREERVKLEPTLSHAFRGFSGDAGVAVKRSGCGWTLGGNFNEWFPQQSVTRLWVMLAIFDAVDRGRISLDDRLNITSDDLGVFNQPLRGAVIERGKASLTISQALERALIHSDRLAYNKLLTYVGGAEAVREMLGRKGLSGIRFSPSERQQQSRATGLKWRSQFALGSNFIQAKAGPPLKAQQDALDRYLINPADGATPSSIAAALVKHGHGRLLSRASTKHLLQLLGGGHSGLQRLKACTPSDWTVYYKMGTGQISGKNAIGYNDVVLLMSPGGNLYSAVVMIAKTSEPIVARTRMMETVTRAIVGAHLPMVNAKSLRNKPHGTGLYEAGEPAQLARRAAQTKRGSE